MIASRIGAAVVTVAVLLPPVGLVVGTVPPAFAEEKCERGKVHYEDRPSYGLTRLGAGNAWDVARGRGVKVAVIDSGVEDANAHLSGAMVDGVSMLPGDASRGRDDDYGHGTAVAGLIAARPVAGSKLAGLAPEATIVPVRVYVQAQAPGEETSSQGATTAAMAEGIAWAARNGADVINVSMSAGVDDPVLRDAVKLAIARGAVVVAAAGNRGDENEEDGPRYPAAYDGVIGVAATDLADQVNSESSIHGEHVDVTAPGQAVLTTFFDAGDCVIGADRPYSSYATAYVSGLAALLREKFPDATSEEISYRILAGADGAQSDVANPIDGWGMIQPRESLTMVLDPARPGPDFPGSKPADDKQSEQRSVVNLATALEDPLDPARGRLGWWAVLGGGAVALALVLSPLVARVRKPR